VISLDAVSQAHLTEFNRTIARWTRLSGTPDERDAAAYVEEQLRLFGFAAKTVVHDAFISLPRAASLRIIAPEPRNLPCITHSMGIPTDAQPVAAEVVYAATGSPQDYARAGAAGKIAEVDRQHVRADDVELADATRAFAERNDEVAVELDGRQLAAGAQQRQRERALAGPDLDEPVAGLRSDRLDDAAQDARIVQEVLAEALAPRGADRGAHQRRRAASSLARCSAAARLPQSARPLPARSSAVP